MKHKGYFDGSSKGNPGKAQCGWAVLDDQDRVIAHQSRTAAEPRTNNYAEYMGLIELLKFLIEEKEITDIEIFGDSALVINQVNRLWKCKSPNLKDLWDNAVKQFEYLTTLKSVKLTWIPREKNTIADRLAQEGIL